jgi:ParB family chromosome partitioning protein
MEEIKMLKLKELKEFKNHPFKVIRNAELDELMESIEKDGVIVPLLARPNPNGEGYELISGHRRKLACSELGMEEVPVVVRELNDDQAVIAMVDSNLHRERILPSEKAFAYKMKLDAMNKQGFRTDLASGQVVQKLNNPSLRVHHLEINQDEEQIKLVNKVEPYSSRKELSKQVGESEKQIQRYIRLTNLIPQILKMVDDEKIAFTIAVELSYLRESEQYELYAVMDLEQCTPSLSQANRLKRRSQASELDMDEIYIILEEEKPNQKEKIKIRSDLLDPYFPEDFTPIQKIELIQELVKEWYEEQKLIEDRDDFYRGGR